MKSGPACIRSPRGARRVRKGALSASLALLVASINRSVTIGHMNEIDHFALDGHALRLFLAVLEEGAVPRAARRLDLTQSAVSHGLDRLRRIASDPLFVKSGRGIVATAHAESLAEPARALLERMQAFAQGSRFEPSTT